MRTPSAVLYGADYRFELGRGYTLRASDDDVAVIVSSGRGVHEALAASAACEQHGLKVGVVDLPSIDEGLLLRLFETGKLVCLAEQNNGYILQNALRIVHRSRSAAARDGLDRVLAINTLGPDGRPRFIHSGTYEELIEAFGLTPAGLAGSIRARLSGVS
jgi:transketolase C-terminal domain/subunit